MLLSDLGLGWTMTVAKEYMLATGCDIRKDIKEPELIHCTFEQAWGYGLYEHSGLNVREAEEHWGKNLAFYSNLHNRIYVKPKFCESALIVHESVHALQNWANSTPEQREAEAYTIQHLFYTKTLPMFKVEADRSGLKPYDLLMHKWETIIKPTFLGDYIFPEKGLISTHF